LPIKYIMITQVKLQNELTEADRYSK
jgi:hypothetical protein